MSSPTLIIGDGNWAVKSGSLLGYEYGELSGQFAPIPITGSRASIATYTDQSGLIVSASSGVLRVDYSTGTGSLLLEPQRTNLCLYSEQFNVSPTWTSIIGGTGVNPSITTNAVISPDGTQNAETVVFDRGAGNLISNQSTLQQEVTISTTGAYIFSIYAKASSAGDVGKQIFLRVGGAGSLAAITLTANWVRYFKSEASVASGLQILQVGNRGTITAGNTVSVDLWGAQVEAGAYATTYIPTAGSTVTRIADSFNRSNIYTDGVITSGGGTWLVELLNNVLVTRDTSDVGLFIGNSSNGVTGDCLIIRNNGTARLAITKRIAGSQTLLFDTTTNTVKIVFKWNGTNADVFVNGTKVVSATAFATTNMEFFRGLGGDVTKYITQNKLYNQPLSDAECISLTTL